MWPFQAPDRWPEVPIEELRRRARLLIIDDQAFPYKDLFDRDGYTIEKWSDVDDLPRLESGVFDLILLDLQGVGRQQSVEQGLGLLKHLRRVVPTQLVIAYSSADYPLKYQDFFKLADAVLAKDSDYVDFKRQVDQLLVRRFSLGFYTDRVRALLENTVDDLPALHKKTELAIVRNAPGKLEDFLQKRHVDPQLLSMALQIVRTAIALRSLWHH